MGSDTSLSADGPALGPSNTLGEDVSVHQMIEAFLSLPGVCQRPHQLRLHDQWFDPLVGPNKVKLTKVWQLLARPLMQCIRLKNIDMDLLPTAAMSVDAVEEHYAEVARRHAQQRQFLLMWMEATQGPKPSVDWKFDNRTAYQEDFRAFMDSELSHFKAELDAVYKSVQEADGGSELIALPPVDVRNPNLLSQLGAHPHLEWLELLDVSEAFEHLRLVGAVKHKDDEAAAMAFGEMLTYDESFVSGRPFWKNVYRKWLANYAKLADYHFHQGLQTLMEKYNSECEDEGLHAKYKRGPLKTYDRMRKDERERGLVPDAHSYEGRTVSASCLDVVRGTIHVGSPQAILALLDRFSKLKKHGDKFEIVQVKNHFNKESEGMHGYRYVELNVHFKLGLTTDACDRPEKHLHVALVGEVVIALDEYVSIKERRSLQYKLWRGFYDWTPQDDIPRDATDSMGVARMQSYNRGNAGLYEDDL